MPEIPAGFEDVWAWFWELSDGRGNSGFGPLPISYADMSAWGELSGVVMEPWLVKIFRAMDNAWLEETIEKQKKRNRK